MSNLEPGRNPPRYQSNSRGSLGWAVAAVAALMMVVLAAIYGMTDHSRMASNAPNTTTQQTSPVQARPSVNEPATNR